MVCIDWFGFFYVECIVGRDDTNVTIDPVQYETKVDKLSSKANQFVQNR